jgi:general stress protein 26
MSNVLQENLFSEITETPIMMVSLNKNADHSEPMHICLEQDNYKSFWIFTTKDNRIAGGGKSMAQFVGSNHKLFACFVGHLVEETDRSKIEEHFSMTISSWYKNGLIDENLEVLRFDVETVEIWEKDPTTAAKLKMAIGIKVNQDELGRHSLV